MVGPSVAAVELVGRRGQVARAPAVEAPGGVATGLRLFVVEAPTSAVSAASLLRLLDTDGTIRRAEQVEGETFEDPAVGRARRVLTGRVGTARWVLRAVTRRRFAPTPLQPERFADYGCVGLAGRDEVCGDDLEHGVPMSIVTETQCGATGGSITLLARPVVRRVVAELGDGRRVRVALRGLPPVFGGARGGGVVVNPRTAVRRLLVNGPPTRTLDVGLPPADAVCRRVPGGGSGSSGFSEGTTLEPPPEPPATGPPTLVARDEGDLLCVGIDHADACALPPRDPDDMVVDDTTRGGVTFFAGVVPEDASAVVVTLDDRTRHEIPATLEGPYAGQYAGRVRFFSATLPGEHSVRRLELFAGTLRVGSLEPPGPTAPVVGPRRILRARGAPDLWAARIPPLLALQLQPFLGFFGEKLTSLPHVPCVALGRPARTAELPCTALAGTLQLSARCNTHRHVLFGLLSAGTRSIEVQLAGGRVLREATVAVPRSIGAGGRAVLLALPRGARPVEVITRGARTRRTGGSLRPPPATAQCGYEATVNIV
jgi:hypothetical protein